ncbi:hypothetical protein [Deinococcus soli (ex Cha et al. 2016)]|uniref:hypothetical protein n=1 Tax=Deinococcus soli (ex Cha et al. 2016) TaxID=1309411 RepID=UPI001662B2E1|nr:hypothetical protein [Deinococcus soli (ex Cha et al. 2016)]GGB64658.1 hypothetical protein GCM10008019_20970 [Deinococcus soli (ex Cha et al. 2016)]
MPPLQLNRRQKVMNVMLTDPKREWTPSEVSIVLGVSPKVTAEPMGKLARRGELVRGTERGRYRVATREERAAFARAQAAASVVAAIPEPAPTPVAPITESERIIMLRTLRHQSRPMAAALIAGRLGKCGIRLARTDELLALLAAENAVRQLDDGRWELVA